VIFPSGDAQVFNGEDAQLNVQNGIPRFYIMQLHNKGQRFHKITRHERCTQCLGSLEGKDWLMVVCPPYNDIDNPVLEELATFPIPGNCFIKLEVVTWHAGPYCNHEFVDFYNLELSDTNVLDYFTHDFITSHQLVFEML
jgi:ureidoglycolate hydrolase